MKKMIYMDHAATTELLPEARAAMEPFLRNEYGNASTSYDLGRRARQAVEHARALVAEAIGAQPEEIYFTSGGSESDNWAIRSIVEMQSEYGGSSQRDTKSEMNCSTAGTCEGCGMRATGAYGLRGMQVAGTHGVRGTQAAGTHGMRGIQVITSAIEHHAVLHSCEYLEKLGYKVTYLPVDRRGVVSPEDLEMAFKLKEMEEKGDKGWIDSVKNQERAVFSHQSGDGMPVGQERQRYKGMKADLQEKNTCVKLVSIMYANNEIGTIEPIDELGRIAWAHGALFHTDAVQAIGQIPVSVRESPIDCLSASGHKFHGPKGVGFLYVRSGIAIPSLIHGGGQERGKRAGTENVAGIVGMAEALRVAVRGQKANSARITYLREHLVHRIMRETSDTLYNGHPIDRLPGSASFSFRGVNATALLVLLEEAGICASAASACTAGTTEVSHVIRAIGVPEDYAEGTIRLTLGRENSLAEVNYCVQKLKESVQLLRMAG